jgi:Rad3-related DNA helicase
MRSEQGPLGKFPHDNFRSGQKGLIKKLSKVINHPEIKFAIIEAPTGFGKTAVAGSVAANSGNSYYLTEQKIHQDQLSGEFPRYTTICKGQRNYECREECDECVDAIPDLTCHRKPTTNREGVFAGESARRGELYWKQGLGNPCPYFKHKTDAMEDEVAGLNYSYFFAETHYSGDFGNRDVMICDEAHNIGRNLQSFLSFRVDTEEAHEGEDEFDLMSELGIPLRDLGDEISHWEEWLVGSLHSAVQGRLSEVEDVVEDQWEDSGGDRSEVDYELLDKQDKLDEIACNIRRFDEQYDDEYFDDMDWAVEKEYEGDDLVAVSFTPVSVAPFTGRFLWDYADTVIMMSATILDFDILCRSLGLMQHRDKIWTCQFPSPFDPDIRPVEWFNGPSINHDSWGSKFPHTCRLVDAVCQKEEHLNEPGLIHSVSYQNEEMILNEVSRPTRRRIIHHGERSALEREEALKKFKESDNAILMSPGMFEGVDLKYDKSRFQIFPKIPYLSLGSSATRKRKDRDPQWYQWRTIIRMIQGMGRSVRADDDYAKTYILDGSFKNLLKMNRSMFPDYIAGEEGSMSKGNIQELVQETKAVMSTD